jgi:hypothetical protein
MSCKVLLRLVFTTRKICLSVRSLHFRGLPLRCLFSTSPLLLTVRRLLSFFGYKRRIVKKKIIVSNVNRFKRRAWCRSKLHCTVENFWKKVIFSDETQIVLGKGSKVHVWRKECEQWALYCLGEGRTRQPRVVASVSGLCAGHVITGKLFSCFH